MKRSASVCIRGEKFEIPCNRDEDTIQWVGDEAIKRYKQPQASEEKVYEIRKFKSGDRLDLNGRVKDVLDDDDIVSVVLESDQSSPVTGPAEGAFIPASVSGEPSGLPDKYLSLDGNSLTPDDLIRLGKGKFKIKLTPDAWEKVEKARKIIDKIVKENKVVYGITTGFGEFANKVIPRDKLIELQENLIRSHAAGVGNPLTLERTRMLLALRINILSKGYSGITAKTLKQYIDAFNATCLP